MSLEAPLGPPAGRDGGDHHGDRRLGHVLGKALGVQAVVAAHLVGRAGGPYGVRDPGTGRLAGAGPEPARASGSRKACPASRNHQRAGEGEMVPEHSLRGELVVRRGRPVAGGNFLG